MKVWKTKRGHTVCQVSSRRSNAYFVSAGSLKILVDTGSRRKRDEMYLRIDRLRPTDEKIDFLILTHTHFDHCQNAAEIKSREKCLIIVGEAEKAFTETGYTPIPKGTNMITGPLSLMGKRLLSRRHFSYAPFSSDIQVTGDYDLKDNLKIKVMTTPGHSAGSLSVLVDNEIALVGDTLFGIFRHKVLPSFADDIPEMIRSWNKLMHSGCKVFLPGHGRAVDRELMEKEFARYARKYGMFQKGVDESMR